MCGLKVRFSQSPERRGVFEYALRVEVVSSEGIPSKIFVYHQFPAGIDGNTFAEFDHVATPVDLQEIPEDAASETVPWYRTDKCVAWFRCASDLKTAKQLFVDDITHLQRSYNILTREEDFENQTTVVFSGEKVETEGGGNDPYEDAIEELRKDMNNKVNKDALEGVDISDDTVDGVRKAVKQIGKTLGAAVRGIAVAAGLGLACTRVDAAGVYKADLNTLNLDKNPQVVTNVSLEGLASTSNVDAMVSESLTNYYTKAETEDAIDSLAAYYITFNADGDAFPTYSALASATNFYSGGQVRVPTRNDYCVVLADEEHGGSEWRYIYAVHEGASSGQWEAQYPIETNDYEGLSNKPQIGGVVLTGNKSAADLGLLPSDENALVGNSSFSGAVVRVSPPADTSDCVKTNDIGRISDEITAKSTNAAIKATSERFRPFGDEYVYESKGMGDFTYESENADIIAALGTTQPYSWEDGDYVEYYIDIEADGRYWWGNAYVPKNSPVVTFMFYSDYWDEETGDYFYDEVEVIGRRQPGGWDRTNPLDTFAHQSELTSINSSITSLRNTLNGESKVLRTGKYGEYGTGYGYVQRMLDNERRIWRIRVPKFSSVSGMTTNNSTMTPFYRTVDNATTPSSAQEYTPRVLSNIQTWLPGWNFSRKLRETRGIYGTDSVSFADYNIGLFFGGGTNADMCVLNYVVAHTNRSPMCFNVSLVTNRMTKIVVDATQGHRDAFIKYVDYPQVHVRQQTANYNSYTVTNENWLTMKALGFYEGTSSTSNGTIPLNMLCIFDAELKSEYRQKNNGNITVRTASVTNLLTTATVTINCTSATTLENVYAPYYRLVTTHDEENNFYYDAARDCTYRIAVTNGCFYADWVMDGDWRKKGL